MKRLLRLLVMAPMLGACAMPTTTVRTTDTRPSLVISGATGGSTLYVDGQSVGPAASYDGHPSVLKVEPGTHEVDLRDASGRILFRQKVFVESETKTIEVH
jgi:uncharacterized lipoprotein YajG